MTNRLMILLAGTVLTVSACAKHDEANNTMAVNDTNMMTNNGTLANGDMNAAAPASAMTA